MCGFIFIFDKKIDKKKAQISLDSMIHRGPDEQKISLVENIFMGFNRLSIQDVSPNAMQPLHEKINDNEFYLMFNGEVYNFLDLKKTNPKIKDLNYKSNSDTEVLSKLYLNYGFEKTLDLLNGMFAFCIYDKKKPKSFFS